MSARSLRIRLLASLAFVLAMTLAPVAGAGVAWVGKKAPELSIETLLNAPSDVPLTLEGHKGRALVIEFFSVDCPKCREAMPHFNELAREMRNQPITFIALTNESEQAVRSFMTEIPMSAYVGLDPDWSMWQDYVVLGVPLAVVINPDGVIAAIVHPKDLSAPMLRDVIAGRTPNVKVSELLEDPNAPEAQRNKAIPFMEVEVRPAQPGERTAIWMGEEFRARAATLADLLALVLNVESHKFVSDDLLLDARYDVRITPPTPNAKATEAMLKAVVEQMVQPRLAKTERAVPVYVLRSRPAGAMLLTKGEGQPDLKGGDGFVEAKNVPIQQIVANLQRDLRAPVIDETNLEGGWNFSMKWNPDDPASLVEALRQQLGLDVRREQRVMEVYLVKRGE